MNDLVGCRDMELLCRRRAVLDPEHDWKWLGDAERWKDLAHREIASRFQKNLVQDGPMAIGPNAIEGHRSHKLTMKQCLQSEMGGG